MRDELKKFTAAELLEALNQTREQSRNVDFAVVLDSGDENSWNSADVPVSITDPWDIRTYCAMQERGFSIRLHEPAKPEPEENEDDD